MKHGPIALIDHLVPVIVLAPSGPLFDKTVSNMQEVRARGGQIVLISDAEGLAAAGEGCMATIEMPSVHPLIAPLFYAVAAQLLAYQVAVLKGTDTRFFMTIPEASQLVIQAGAMAHGGKVFLLDMGQPVRITDLAKEMIKLSGLTVRDEANPDGDIVIEEVGLRPGEKLFEELLISAESVPTAHPRVVCGREERLHWSALHPALSRLRSEVDRMNVHSAVQIVRGLVPSYCSPRSPSANARELETSAA